MAEDTGKSIHKREVDFLTTQMNSTFWSIVLSLSMASQINGYAFDKTGHRIIAQIAAYALKPQVKYRIESILGKNGLVHNANWADEVRSNHTFDYAVKWHYFSVDSNYSSSELDSVFRCASMTKNNLLFAIDSLVHSLRKNRKDTIALRFLIHLVGDLHQPLHLGKSIDQGGNSIRIKWFNDSITVHALWDSHLINIEQLSYSEYSKFLFEMKQYSDIRLRSSNLLFSFKESYRVSRKIYGYDYSNLNAYSYHYIFSSDLNRLLILGGYQLSSILNEIYS